MNIVTISEIQGVKLDDRIKTLLKTSVINFLRSNGIVRGVRVEVSEHNEQSLDTLLENEYRKGYEEGRIDAKVLPE